MNSFLFLLLLFVVGISSPADAATVISDNDGTTEKERKEPGESGRQQNTVSKEEKKTTALENKLRGILNDKETRRKILEGTEGVILLFDKFVDAVLDELERKADDIKKNKEIYREKIKKKLGTIKEILRKELEMNEGKNEEGKVKREE